jgi:hypothetical protein
MGADAGAAGGAGAGGGAVTRLSCCAMKALAAYVASNLQLGHPMPTGIRPLTGSTSNLNRVPHWHSILISMDCPLIRSNKTAVPTRGND